MLYYSQTSTEPPVKCTVNTPDPSFPKQIKNLSNFLSGWSRNRKNQGLFINVMQLQQEPEFFFFPEQITATKRPVVSSKLT
jgi:penicillin V acylase-like amidase (Ntn superfamily)